MMWEAGLTAIMGAWAQYPPVTSARPTTSVAASPVAAAATIVPGASAAGGAPTAGNLSGQDSGAGTSADPERAPLTPDTPTGPPPAFAATILELELSLQVTLARINATGYGKMPNAASAAAPPVKSVPRSGSQHGTNPGRCGPAGNAIPADRHAGPPRWPAGQRPDAHRNALGGNPATARRQGLSAASPCLRPRHSAAVDAGLLGCVVQFA